MTRVITLLLGIEQSPRNYPEIGITEGHHGLTHHQGDKAKIEKVTQINEYHIKQFIYLLDKLKSTQRRRRHAARQLDDRLRQRPRRRQSAPAPQPADRAGGPRARTLHPGRHVRYADETPMANLYLSMLDRMAVPIDTVRRQHRAARGALGPLS